MRLTPTQQADHGIKEQAIQRVGQLAPVAPVQHHRGGHGGIGQAPQQPGHPALALGVVPNTAHGGHERNHEGELQEQVGVSGLLPLPPDKTGQHGDNQHDRLPTVEHLVPEFAADDGAEQSTQASCGTSQG